MNRSACGSDNVPRKDGIERTPHAAGDGQAWRTTEISVSIASRGQAVPSILKPAPILFLAAALTVFRRPPAPGTPRLRPMARRCKPASPSRRKTRRRAGSMALTNSPRKPAPRRLDAAREAAPRQAESCIGVVSTACIQAEGNESTAVMLDCYGREAQRLGRAAQRRLQASAEKRRRRRCRGGLPQSAARLDRLPGCLLRPASHRLQGLHGRADGGLLQAGHDRPPSALAGALGAVVDARPASALPHPAAPRLKPASICGASRLAMAWALLRAKRRCRASARARSPRRRSKGSRTAFPGCSRRDLSQAAQSSVAQERVRRSAGGQDQRGNGDAASPPKPASPPGLSSRCPLRLACCRQPFRRRVFPLPSAWPEWPC